MSNESVISIDIGLKFTRAYARENSKTDFIPIKSIGRDFIPTLIGLKKNGICIGSEAKNMIGAYPTNVITNMLFFVGRKYSEDLKKFSTAKMISKDGEIYFDFDHFWFNVTECLFYFISGIIELSNVKNPSVLSISVPSYWSVTQKRILYNACKQIGIPSIYLVPSNVCKALTLMERNLSGPFVIADIGERRLQISNIFIDQNDQPVLDHYSDYNLNSRIISTIVGKYVYKRMWDKNSDKDYREFLESLKKNDEKNELYILEIEDLKAKLIPRGDVKFTGTSLTCDFEPDIIIKGQDILNKRVKVSGKGEICLKDEIDEISSRISDEYDGQCRLYNASQAVLEIPGGFGYNAFLSETFAKEKRIEVTALLPQNCNALGAGFFTCYSDKEKEEFLNKFYGKTGFLNWELYYSDDVTKQEKIILEKSPSNYKEFSFIAEGSFTIFLKKRNNYNVKQTEDDDDEEDIIPYFPDIQKEDIIFKAECKNKKATVKGKLNIFTGVIEIKQNLYFTEEELIKQEISERFLKRMNEKKQNEEKLQKCKNDFQEFYYKINRRLSRKEYADYDDENVKKIKEIVEEASNEFDSLESAEYFQSKIEEYKRKMDKINEGHVRDKIEKKDNLGRVIRILKEEFFYDFKDKEKLLKKAEELYTQSNKTPKRSSNLRRIKSSTSNSNEKIDLEGQKVAKDDGSHRKGSSSIKRRK